MSVGRLGIITQLTLNILPQQAVQRSETDMTVGQFADQIKLVQDAYTQAKQTGSAQAVWEALHSLNETQVSRRILPFYGVQMSACMLLLRHMSGLQHRQCTAIAVCLCCS